MVFDGSINGIIKLFGHIALLKALPRKCLCMQVASTQAKSLTPKKQLILGVFVCAINVGVLRIFLNKVYPVKLVQD